MPRGIRKRGALDCTIWFADGSRFQLTSHRELTNAEILASVEKNLMPLLTACAKPLADDAVGMSFDQPVADTAR